MHTLTDDELTRRPHQFIESAQRGEPTMVTRHGEPVLLSVPLGKGIESSEVRTLIAMTLFDCEHISLGLAARIAGVSCSEMINELGRRGVSVIRLQPGELERELAAFDD